MGKGDNGSVTTVDRKIVFKAALYKKRTRSSCVEIRIYCHYKMEYVMLVKMLLACWLAN